VIPAHKILTIVISGSLIGAKELIAVRKLINYIMAAVHIMSLMAFMWVGGLSHGKLQEIIQCLLERVFKPLGGLFTKSVTATQYLTGEFRNAAANIPLLTLNKSILHSEQVSTFIGSSPTPLNWLMYRPGKIRDSIFERSVENVKTILLGHIGVVRRNRLRTASA
jgi:hypothetical protein